MYDERVRAMAGDAAFGTDEDGDRSLSDPWASGKEALLHAAMAFGAPELLSDPDRRTLLRAWESCFRG